MPDKHNWDAPREAPKELVLQLSKWLEDNDVRAKDLAEWLVFSGWLEKHDSSPFIAPPLTTHPHPSLEAWQAHMAALGEEIHKRSHELNPSVGYGGSRGTDRDYISFIQQLADVVAYLFNSNSNPTDGFVGFDKEELTKRLQFAANRVK